MTQTRNNQGRRVVLEDWRSGRLAAPVQATYRQPAAQWVRPGGGARTVAGSVRLVGVEALDFDYDIEVDIDAVLRRPVVSSLTVRRRRGGVQITARSVAGEVAAARRLAVGALTHPIEPDGSILHGRGRRPSTADVQAALRHASRGPQPPSRRELEKVAKVYVKAQRQEQGTTAAVAATLGVSSSTARKRVMQARAEGLLPPAEGTRPKLPR